MYIVYPTKNIFDLSITFDYFLIFQENDNFPSIFVCDEQNNLDNLPYFYAKFSI